MHLGKGLSLLRHLGLFLELDLELLHPFLEQDLTAVMEHGVFGCDHEVVKNLKLGLRPFLRHALRHKALHDRLEHHVGGQLRLVTVGGRRLDPFVRVLPCGRNELAQDVVHILLIGQAHLEGHAVEHHRQQALNGLRLRGLIRVQRIGLELKLEPAPDLRRVIEGAVRVLAWLRHGRDFVLLVRGQEGLVQFMELLIDLGQSGKEPAQEPFRAGIALL